MTEMDTPLGDNKMRITYSAVISGSIDIPDEELAGKSEEEREICINTLVAEQAAEDVEAAVEWEEE